MSWRASVSAMLPHFRSSALAPTSAAFSASGKTTLTAHATDKIRDFMPSSMHQQLPPCSHRTKSKSPLQRVRHASAWILRIHTIIACRRSGCCLWAKCRVCISRVLSVPQDCVRAWTKTFPIQKTSQDSSPKLTPSLASTLGSHDCSRSSYPIQNQSSRHHALKLALPADVATRAPSAFASVATPLKQVENATSRIRAKNT